MFYLKSNKQKKLRQKKITHFSVILKRYNLAAYSNSRLNSSITDNTDIPNMYFCPSGKLISSSPSNIEKDLENHCQCSCCDKYNFSRTDLDCSGGFFGDILADNETFNALWACKVKSSKE